MKTATINVPNKAKYNLAASFVPTGTPAKTRNGNGSPSSKNSGSYKKKSYQSNNKNDGKSQNSKTQMTYTQKASNSKNYGGASAANMKPTPTKQSVFKVSKGVDHFFKVKSQQPQFVGNMQTATPNHDQLGKLETEKFESFGPLNMADESTESNSQNNSPSGTKHSSMVLVKSGDNLTSSESSPDTDGPSAERATRIESRMNANTVITDFQQPIKNKEPEIVVEGGESNNFEAITSENDENYSGYQSTDFQTAYENQSGYPSYLKNKNGDSISENDQSNFQDKINQMMAEGGDAHSANYSRRGSFSITTASEMMNHNDVNSTINDSEITSALNDQNSMNDNTSVAQQQQVNMTQAPINQGSKFKLNATPFFIPKDKLQKGMPPVAMAPQANAESTPQQDQSKGASGSSLMKSGLDALTIDNEFTPSTPYVHKFRTELCKNFALYGKCKWGDECSFAHGKTHMMVKTDVSVLYKTKLCKKFSANGYCPYGMRCQFIHDISETNQPFVQQTQKIKQQHHQHQTGHVCNKNQQQVAPVQFTPTLPPIASIKNQEFVPEPELKKTESSMSSRQNTARENSDQKEQVVEKKDMSVVNAQPFVPKLKLPASGASSQLNSVSARKEVPAPAESVAAVEQEQVPVKKVSLNPESVAFVPKQIVQQPVPQAPAPVAVGGFGNKQTSIALANEKTVYSEVLVHCVKMSIQEYQKKLKMFNKKVNNKKRYLDIVEPPTIQYMNIYAHGNVPRLSCFQKITECSAAFLNIKEDDDNEGGYFYGDATSYEKHLEQQLSRYEKALKAGHYQQKTQFNTQAEIAPMQTQQQQQTYVNQYNQNIINYLSQVGVGNMNTSQPLYSQSNMPTDNYY